MKIFLLSLVVTIGISTAASAFAAVNYVPMVTLPRLGDGPLSTQEYVNALYLLSITLGALLAFVKIIFGGVKWMLSDMVTDKSSAKKDIWGALLGLLIILSAVIILQTINSDLTNLNILRGAPELEGVEDTSTLQSTELGDTLDRSTATDKQINAFHTTCRGRLSTKDNIMHCDPINN